MRLKLFNLFKDSKLSRYRRLNQRTIKLLIQILDVRSVMQSLMKSWPSNKEKKMI